MSQHRRHVPVGCALAAFSAAYLLVNTRDGRWWDAGLNIVQVLAAAGAAGACLRAFRRRGDRGLWLGLGVGCVGWAVGQLFWTGYEAFGNGYASVPSPADIGFLVFPVASVLGMASVLRGGSRAAGLRGLLDGALAVCALLAAAWETVLGQVLAAETDRAGLVVAAAYPVSDVLLISVLLVLVARPASPERSTVRLLTAGVVVFAVADTGYAWLNANGTWTGRSMYDLGWPLGMILIGLAAVAGPRVSSPVPIAERPVSVLALAAPYLPVVLAAVLVGRDKVADGVVAPAALVLFGVVVLLVLARQFLVVLENRRLTARVQQGQAALQHQAFHDSLTALPNRSLFLDRLEHAVALWRRDGRPLSVLYLDLDGFKDVNDSLGHAAGDLVLAEVSRRLRAAIRPGDTVARLGGDEFAVLLEGEDQQPLPVAHALLLDICRPVSTADAHGHPVPVDIGASIGLASTGGAPGIPVTSRPTTGEDLLRDADAAMYVAKRRGKSQVQSYEPVMSEDRLDAAGGARLAAELSRALADGELTSAYQPVVDLVTGVVVGMEALARWTHPRYGVVSPEVFVAAAERSGLTGDLRRVMLRRGLADCGRWPDRVAVAVNVSMVEVGIDGLAEEVLLALDDAGLPGSRLVLELTETTACGDWTVAVKQVQRLRAHGVTIALDDVGTGQATLQVIDTLPLDVIKIDRSFVSRLTGGPQDEASVVAMLLRLAAARGRGVVAEGLETEQQVQALQRLGCPHGQGFLLGRPAPVDQLGPLWPRRLPVAVPGPRLRV